MALTAQDPEEVSRLWGSGERQAEVSDMLIQLLDFLLPNGISPSELPEGYRPVYEAIAGFLTNPLEQLKEYRKEVELAKQGLPLVKMNQEFNRIIRRYKKRLTREQIYNRVCTKYPQASYLELHKYLARVQYMPAASLRVYKKRRIEKTRDFRGDQYASIKAELKRVKDCFIQNGYRMTKAELFRACGLDMKRVNRVLLVMKKQGMLEMTKERKNSKYRRVLVFLKS